MFRNGFYLLVICIQIFAIAKGNPPIAPYTPFNIQEMLNQFGEVEEQSDNEYGNGEEVQQLIFNQYHYLTQYYLPNSRFNISKQCDMDLRDLADVFKNHEPGSMLRANRWALKLVDSWGKSEDGIIGGNQRAVGFFEECLHVERVKGDFYGRYCLMHISKSAVEVSSNVTRKAATHFKPSVPFPSLSAYFSYATCIPASCTQLELERSVTNALVEAGHQKRATAQCQSLVDEKPFDSSEIFGIVFFALILVLLVVASLVDVLIGYTKLKDLRGKNIEYLLAFSVPANMKKIFDLNFEPSKDVITCAQGLRFMSISVIIMGHTYYYSLFVASNTNTIKSQLLPSFLFQIILNSDKAVDTFFFLGGLFLALSFFRMTKTSSKFSYFNYLTHRVVRLVPPIAILVCFLATLSGFLVTGPNAVKYDEYVVGGCRKNWWVDWIFVNNFLFRFADQVFHNPVKISCVPQSWYVAVDMQLYVFMPLVLLPLMYWKKKGLMLLGFWTILSFAIPAIIIGTAGTYPSTTFTLNFEKSLEYSILVYMMPYCRASPYFVGIWTGYLLWKMDGKKVKLSVYQVIAGWTTASAVALIIIFAYYPFNHMAIPAKEMGLSASVIYGGFQRGVWAVCVAWVLVACQWGYGGFVNSFLSHEAFQPLSRLTYTMFLVHLPLIYALLNSTMRPTYYSHVNKISETCGVLFLTGIASLLLSLISESPILRIEKLLRRKPKNQEILPPHLDN